MKKENLTVIQTEYEIKKGDFVYRLIENNNGVIIHRTHQNNQSWSHAVYCKKYTKDGFLNKGCYIPLLYITMEEALKIIGKE